MPEQPFVPPPRKAVGTYTSPVHVDIFYTELVNRDDPAYVQNAPVKRGTLYSQIVGGNSDVSTAYPTLYFLKEARFQQSDQLVLWTWTNDPSAQDTYNATITYALESVTSPTYTRVYTLRRDVYDAIPEIPQGSHFDRLIGVRIIDGGQDYTYATGTIDTGATVDFVVADGVIISGIVTNEGAAITDGGQITITGDGGGAEATAIIQPASAVLVAQHKEEFPDGDPLENEYVKVTQVYQTLPGPTINSTEIYADGDVVNIATTVKVANTIVSGETLVGTVWTMTTKKQAENAYIGEEIVETRTIPGNPIPSTTVEEDGMIMSRTRTLKDTTLIVSAETLITGTWTKTFKDALTERITFGKGASDLVSWEIVESRPIPGNPIASTKLDEDGVRVFVIKTMIDSSTFGTPDETLVTGTWTRKHLESITDLVGWAVLEIRAIPGNDIVKTTIDAAGDIVTETRTMVAGPPTLVTTITTAGGVYTKTFGEPITELVSWKVVQVKATEATLDSYEAEIPDLLPEEFRPKVPVTTHEETLIGDATAITLPLALGVLFEKNAQIDFNTYRHTIRGRTGISLPQTITNKETTTEFGGGDVDRDLTLDLYNNLSLDEGLTVLTCEIKKIDDQANGLAVKTTRQLHSGVWPILDSTHVDETYGVVIDITKQVVDAGTTGGVSGGVYTEVRSIDKWRSITIASQLDTGSLPEDVQWFSGQSHSFVPELTDAIIEYAEATCGCQEKFAAVLQANLTQYRGQVKTRITDQFYNGPPPDDITIDQFFPQSHTFGFAFAATCGCGSDSTARVTAIAPQFHIPDCLHDDLSLNVGISFTWSFPATSPAALPHGSYIMLAPHIERWRFGVFRRVLTEVLVP